MRRFEEQSDHELLDIRPGASAEEIRAAYRRLTHLLAPDSLAVYSIAQKEELEALHQRLRQAFKNLTGHLPEVHPSSLPGRLLSRIGLRRSEADAPAPAAPAPGHPRDGSVATLPSTGGRYSGFELRRLREERQLTLQQVSARTRISRGQIEDIEAEAFSRLPARAHLRGFVVAYANMLNLDPEEVWESYRERWEAAGFGKPSGPAAV